MKRSDLPTVTRIIYIHLLFSWYCWAACIVQCGAEVYVYMIVWRLRGNIIITALCWVVWHSVHSQQHTHMSSSYRSSRLGLSHWDPYAMRRGGCLELYYCNMVEWSRWDSGLICKTNWFPSVLWHCWFGHWPVKIVPDMTYNVFGGTLNLALSIYLSTFIMKN